MTAIGFLSLVIAVAAINFGKPSTAMHAIITLSLVASMVFLVGGIFRWLWAVMP
jgi:hypothetical protein